jgi:glucose-1-phosphate adenylyltransferase
MTRENAIAVLTPQSSQCQELTDLKRVAAIVLAGGRGKRMRALCDNRPKPALPFGGNNLVIDFTLNNCILSGIYNIIALVDYQRAYMSGYLTQWSSENSRSGTIHIREPQIGSYRGTADAVYQNLDMLIEMGVEEVLILAADHVYQMDYRAMLDFHRRVGADVTISVAPVPIEQAHQFGIISNSIDGQIGNFQEKPDKPESNLASMGIYIFNTEVLAKYLLKDALDADSSHDFGYSVIPRAIESERVFAYRYDSYWQDIGTPEAYYQAHMDLLRGSLTFNLKSNKIDNISKLAPGSWDNIRNSIISENCVVNGLVENSVLSPGVFVSENAIVRNAVVMAGSFIGYGSTICDCIIDEGVEIGDYAYVGPVTSFPAGRRQIHVLNRGMVIPSYANTGNNHQGIEKVDFSSVEADGLVLTRDFNNEDLLSIV